MAEPIELSNEDLDDLAQYVHESESATAWKDLSEVSRSATRQYVRLAIEHERPFYMAALRLLRRVAERYHAAWREEAEREQPHRDRCMGCGNEFTTEGGDIPVHRCNGEVRR